jgi:hypothetical protein
VLTSEGGRQATEEELAAMRRSNQEQRDLYRAARARAQAQWWDVAMACAQRVVADGEATLDSEQAVVSARLVRFWLGDSVLEVEAPRRDGTGGHSSRSLVPRGSGKVVVERIAQQVVDALVDQRGWTASVGWQGLLGRSINRRRRLPSPGICRTHFAKRRTHGRPRSRSYGRCRVGTVALNALRSVVGAVVGWWKAGSEAVLEDEVGFRAADDSVRGHVLEDEVTQGLCVGDGDMQVEVVSAGDVERLQDPGRSDEVVVERGDVILAVAAESDLDDGLQRIPESGGVDDESAASDDAGFTHGADTVSAGGLGLPEPGGQGLVGQFGVLAERREDPQVQRVQCRLLLHQRTASSPA